jgi:hypothetical protein
VAYPKNTPRCAVVTMTGRSTAFFAIHSPR